MENLKKEALASFLGIEINEVEVDGDNFTVGREEYLVLEDHEADSMFSDRLDDYIEECILEQLPENLRFYFDCDKFKRDVELSDGRGPTLSSWDGTENESSVECTSFFIYRQN